MVLAEPMWWHHLIFSTNSWRLTHFMGFVRLASYQMNTNCKGFLLMVFKEMGGNRRRIEQHSCASLRKKKIWRILQHGNFTPFLERLYGHDLNASMEFVSCWHNCKI